MSKREILTTVRELLDAQLPEMGLELWNVEYVKAGKDFELIVSIDKSDGIGTDDCEAVSKFLSAKLDVLNLIEDSYYLIVSSPGLDRPLLTDVHYKRYEGEEVDVSLYKGLNGTKKLSGVLVRRTETDLVIIAEGDELVIPRDIVSRVRLKVVI